MDDERQAPDPDRSTDAERPEEDDSVTGFRAAPLPAVPLELFAAINREVAEGGTDVAHAIAEHEVTYADWQDAIAGWSERIRADITVARRFNQLYTRPDPA